MRSGKAPLDAATTEALVRAARGVRARPPRPLIKPSSHIYVILLEYEEAKYGLYVGMTGRSPESDTASTESRLSVIQVAASLRDRFAARSLQAPEPARS